MGEEVEGESGGEITVEGKAETPGVGMGANGGARAGEKVVVGVDGEVGSVLNGEEACKAPDESLRGILDELAGCRCSESSVKLSVEAVVGGESERGEGERKSEGEGTRSA
jgi:hypothetical protein